MAFKCWSNKIELIVGGSPHAIWQKLNDTFSLRFDTDSIINCTVDLNSSVNAMPKGVAFSPSKCASERMNLMFITPSHIVCRKMSWKILICFRFPLNVHAIKWYAAATVHEIKQWIVFHMQMISKCDSRRKKLLLLKGRKCARNKAKLLSFTLP